ncbi:MAG: M48 family metallopeptidase [Gemmiger formicilis]|uniref:M48 family metallopeptidase n=1 Tax=Gemmiger formicilis TaxID=745368 RepID=UPI0039A2C656
MASEMMRHVRCENREISYLLEQKPVKNLNLRIHKDGRVFLSANPDVPASEIDAFILSKASYIFAAQDKFAEIARYSPQPKQYVSGETFYFLGRGLRLKVASAAKETVYTDGVYLFLNVKNTTDFSKKQQLVTRYLDRQCEAIFGEVLDQAYPSFQKIRCGKTSASYPFHGHSLGFLSSKKADHYTE